MKYTQESKDEIIRLRVENRMSNKEICGKLGVNRATVERSLKGLHLTKHEKSVLNSKNFPNPNQFSQMSEEEIAEKKKFCAKLRSEGLMLKHISLIVRMPVSAIHQWIKTVEPKLVKVESDKAVARGVTLNQFKEIVSSSISVREALLKMGLNGTGYSYTTFYKRIKDNNIDISHFKGMGHGKNTHYLRRARPIEQILVYGKIEAGSGLRERLIREGIKERHCEAVECGMTKWYGRPLPLQVHHVDGDRLNNRIENLQFLCPNCHSLTDNYGIKNRGRKY